MLSKGSVWQKWDLHVHSPASFHWRGKKLHEMNGAERDGLCLQMIARMNEVDVAAFCIMDYWTFDGYLLLNTYDKKNPNELTKTVFPGIELRLEAAVDYRLNTHVLFSDTTPPEQLTDFLANLRVGGPSGKPPSRTNLIAIARDYDSGKLKSQGFKEDDRANEAKMLQLATMTVEITRESLIEAMNVVGREKCLLIQPYDTNDGLDKLDWKLHPYNDTVLMRMADCFETRKEEHVNLFLNRGYPKKPEVQRDFLKNLGNRPKPVFSGSDAHAIKDYGVYPSERATWLKAKPNFAGLRQVCNEPSLRCHIGKPPPKLSHVTANPTKYMREILISRNAGSALEEDWFDDTYIPLNPGLIAIIGNKGSGKSALADVIALAGNARCDEMEFLNDTRFRAPPNRSKHFTATIRWEDGSSSIVGLHQNPDPNQPERVRYLPQHAIEELCNEIATGKEMGFEQELKKVIFSHVPDERRLEKGTLDELIDYEAAIRRSAIAQHRVLLHSLNDEIIHLEQETSEDALRAHLTSLALKEAELTAHENSRPAEVAPPTEVDQSDTLKESNAKRKELSQLRERITELTAERARLSARAAVLTRAEGHLSNLEKQIERLAAEAAKELSEVGLEFGDVFTWEIRRVPVQDKKQEIDTRLATIASLLDGSAEDAGLSSKANDCEAEMARLNELLGAPQRQYQEYQLSLEAWEKRRSELIGSEDRPDTLQYVRARIQRIEGELPDRLAQLRGERLQCVRDIHSELRSITELYKDLYAPVQAIARKTELASELRVQFDAFILAPRFEDNFLDFIHRNRRGAFYGDEEGRQTLRSMLRENDLGSEAGAVLFVETLLAALTKEADGGAGYARIVAQLRPKKRVEDLYNFIFGLEYLEPRYTLRLGEREITQLSPGEKGALLLAFYLLLDREEIPIIIDQPEQNLDNESVVRLLVGCIREARARRQVVIVTHNPNLAVVCDADQIICSNINREDKHRIVYSSGAIEDYDINAIAVNVLEGTYSAFDNRRRKYHEPTVDYSQQAESQANG